MKNGSYAGLGGGRLDPNTVQPLSDADVSRQRAILHGQPSASPMADQALLAKGNILINIEKADRLGEPAARRRRHRENEGSPDPGLSQLRVKPTRESCTVEDICHLR